MVDFFKKKNILKIPVKSILQQQSLQLCSINHENTAFGASYLQSYDLFVIPLALISGPLNQSDFFSCCTKEQSD